MVLIGTVCADQNDRSSTDRAGDFAIRDTNTPWTIEHHGYSEVLAIAIPRQRLEGVLGSARIFAGLTVRGHLPVATLTRSFLSNLMREGDRLSDHVAERMAGIGIDLVVACLAERLAQEVPRPLSGTVVVQRAKAYVEAHLSDASLNPLFSQQQSAFRSVGFRNYSMNAGSKFPTTSGIGGLRRLLGA